MSLFGLFDLIIGFYEAVIPEKYAERVINALLRRGIPHGRMRRCADGSLRFPITRKNWRELRAVIDKSGVLGYSVIGKGLPFLLGKYRRRAGFAAGAILFLCLSCLSTLFIWRIDVKCDGDLNGNQIERNLAGIGVRAGTFIPASDFRELSARYLSEYDDCSWFSINMDGTVACVETRQRLGRPASADDFPCNVVARYGGVIDSFVINSGKGCVEPGTVVKEGDLLVSGLIEDIQGALRICHADAEVYAETEREISVTVPFAHTVRSYTGNTAQASSLLFFGAAIPVPFGDADPGDGWERSEGTDVLLLPDGTPLPLAKNTVLWREYGEEILYYSPDEAKSKADAALDRLISDELCDARILGVRKTFTEETDGVRATAYVRCICDIAKTGEIEIIEEKEINKKKG